MTRPAVKSESAPSQARSVIKCHQRSLQKQRRGPAHWINERLALAASGRPVRSPECSGGNIFFEWRQPTIETIPPPMQTLTTQINAQTQYAFIQARVNSQTRCLDVNIGSGTSFGSVLVDDGILDSQGTELRVANVAALTREIHHQGLTCRDMRQPINLR